jgi:hypothetical protein
MCDKLSLCITKHDALKMFGRGKVYLPALLTLALNGGEWSTSIEWFLQGSLKDEKIVLSIVVEQNIFLNQFAGFWSNSWV